MEGSEETGQLTEEPGIQFVLSRPSLCKAIVHQVILMIVNVFYRYRFANVFPCLKYVFRLISGRLVEHQTTSPIPLAA